MDDNKVLYRIPRNSEEEIRLALRTYKGKEYLDIRLWFIPREGGREFFPTKKGVTFTLEQVDELKKGVETSIKMLREFALQSQPNSVE